MLYVNFKVDHENWTKNIDWTKNSLSILDIKDVNDYVRVLVEFKGDENEFKKMGWNLSKVSRYKYLGTIDIDDKVEKILSKYIIMNGSGSESGFYWTVVLTDYFELKRMLKEFVDSKINIKILKIVKLKSQDILTARQEQILKIALEAGYFDYPKKVKINELAEKLNISISNLSEILRRAEKNVITAFFRERGL
ncbi:helix-turn-helix domain-containing protein [Acidianus manzaensis]|uniref:helix-turn-helix domain-containing protein n=1 Tax=Acidianus manzaensis TaxID=282676 RepID=UPI00164FCB8D|nr:helix-turn-helix domain-containing protein [Acidianus manzaensis]